MSENSTRNDLNYAVDSRAERNRSGFSTAFAALVSAHAAEESYNLSKPGLKKEIQD